MTTTNVIWEDQKMFPIVETLYTPLSENSGANESARFYGVIRVSFMMRYYEDVDLSLKEAECLRDQLDRAIMVAIGKEVAS